ncbi:MAG: exo-alpha-sialidase [Armatimonadetes bacterium]|nr:exo-alpha-sialidase [Armatimonadota bacterium]
MKSKLFILAGVLALSSIAFSQEKEHVQRGPVHEEENVQPLFKLPYATAVGQPALTVTYGNFTAYQVNVNADQHDIVGDAANEPSIAVNPHNPLEMAIGWRQFGTITSDFRQGGNAWSNDGGHTWHNMPPLTDINGPQFRSDPVLTFDSNGQFFYDSLIIPNNNFICQVWNSTDHQNWLGPVYAWGGDKSWIVSDNILTSAGNGNLYQCWSDYAGTAGDNTFSRSIPNAAGFHASWETPVLPTGDPTFGTVDVGPGGEVYDAGMRPDQTNMVITRSDDAKNKFSTPVHFGPSHDFDMGGMLVTTNINPVGLDGQLYCKVAGPFSPFHGTVYCLASVGLWDQFRNVTDNVHVMFVKSPDGGQTFSPPVRVDAVPPSGQNNIAWFGTMSVSPNGRIDCVYNSTGYSNAFGPLTTVTLYTFSFDNGNHWANPIQITPAWNPSIGWPIQQKIGDYYTTISALDHVDLAFSATFSGGQDVYYMRIPAPLSRTPRQGT